MKNRKVVWQSHEKGLIAFAITLIILMFIGVSSWGATHRIPIIQQDLDGELDSMAVVSRVAVGDTAFTTVDSSIIKSFPADTTVRVVDTANWRLLYIYFWLGGAQSTGWDDLIFDVNATASVDYDSIQAIVEAAVTAGSFGGGSDTIVVYAVDTSGTDTAMQDVKITVKNSGGTSVAAAWTNTSGLVTFYLDPGTYTVLGRATGWTYESHSLVVSGNDANDTLFGYNINVGSPSSADLSRVHGWIKDISDNPVIGASVTAVRVSSGDAIDTTGGTTVIISNDAKTAFTDTSGYWYIDLRRTGAYPDTTKGFYNITGEYSGKLFDLKRLYIPSSGNVNLGDTLAGRIQ